MAPLSQMRLPELCATDDFEPPENNPAPVPAPVLEIVVGVLLITRKSVGEELFGGLHYGVPAKFTPISEAQVQSGEWPLALKSVLHNVEGLLRLSPRVIQPNGDSPVMETREDFLEWLKRSEAKTSGG